MLGENGEVNMKKYRDEVSQSKISVPMVNNKTWYVTLTLMAIFTTVSFYQSQSGNLVSYMGKYLLLVVFIIVLSRNMTKGIHINLLKMALLLLLLFIVDGLSLFNTIHLNESLQNVIMYTAVGVLAVYLFPNISFKRFYSILTVMVIILFFFVTIPNLLSIGNNILYSDFGNRSRYLGLFTNANELGRFALIGVLIPLRMWKNSHSRLVKLFFTFMIAANTYIIVLSDSRASLLALLFVAIYFISVYVYKLSNFKLILTSVFTIISIVLLAALLLANSLTFAISDIDFKEVTSGRTDIWEELVNVDSGMSNFLFGVSSMESAGSHNGYLEVFQYFGLIGFIIWMGLLAYIFKGKIKATFTNKRVSVLGLAIVLSLLTYHLVESSLVSIANLASIYFWLEITQRNG